MNPAEIFTLFDQNVLRSGCTETTAHDGSVALYFDNTAGQSAKDKITLTGSALWCDGRFYVQGDRQLAGTEIECMHAGSAGVPTVEEYLTAHFAAGQTLLLDLSLIHI